MRVKTVSQVETVPTGTFAYADDTVEEERLRQAAMVIALVV